ncbi:B-cell receptor-associated 31-like [Macleaya cordata]|uniref:Endoplasmic reticulum transmembrane protein n=1 Tax=Macleaya cordata TaxID=56857 RepID=A0A200RE54_MACCD|nr:B-cell receptor-associated 31-like [Macleaya cordata]
MTDCLHHYIRELHLLRKSMEAVKQQSRVFYDAKSGGTEKVKTMEEEITSLKVKVKKLQSECETKKKELKAAEANTVALRKKTEGFLLEYDSLLEDNQNLRNQ